MLKRKTGSYDEVSGKKFKEDDAPSKKAKEVESSGSITNQREYLQIIVTGPKGCGKSSLVLNYLEQRPPPDGVDFLSKQYLHFLPESDEAVMIWDLDSRVEYSEYRRQSYKEADVALVCFGVKKELVEGREPLLVTVLQPWVDELNEHCEDIPIVLVGIKTDFRWKEPNTRQFGREEVLRALELCSTETYREVSNLEDQHHIKEVFETAIRSVDMKKRKVMFGQSGFKILDFRGFVIDGQN